MIVSLSSLSLPTLCKKLTVIWENCTRNCAHKLADSTYVTTQPWDSMLLTNVSAGETQTRVSPRLIYYWTACHRMSAVPRRYREPINQQREAPLACWLCVFTGSFESSRCKQHTVSVISSRWCFISKRGTGKSMANTWGNIWDERKRFKLSNRPTGTSFTTTTVTSLISSPR